MFAHYTSSFVTPKIQLVWYRWSSHLLFDQNVFNMQTQFYSAFKHCDIKKFIIHQRQLKQYNKKKNRSAVEFVLRLIEW